MSKVAAGLDRLPANYLFIRAYGMLEGMHLLYACGLVIRVGDCKSLVSLIRASNILSSSASRYQEARVP